MRVVDRLRLGWRRKVPVLLQTEAAECGLACIAMVAGYHGQHLDIATLRRRFAVSAHGTRLKALIEIAAGLELESRAVRLELDDLAGLERPCVLHWNFAHFVVLTQVGARTITIHDPSRGARRLALSEAAESFTGVALELWPGAGFERRAAAAPVSLRRLVGRITGLARYLTQILLLAFVLEVFVVANPLLLQWVVDHALVTADADLLTLLAIGFALIVLCEHATRALRAWVIMRFETLLSVQWHANVFGHLLRLSTGYFEKRHLGDIVSRFRSIDAIQRTVTTAFIEALVDGVMVLALAAVMLSYSVMLSALCLAATALYAVSRWLTYAPLRDARAEQLASGAKQESHFIETVRGVRAIKLFGRHDERRGGWLALLVEQVNAGLRGRRLEVLLRSANGLVFGLQGVLIIYLGARLVLAGELTTGMLLAYVAFQRQFAARVNALIDKAFELALLGLHAERLADIVLEAPERRADARLLGGRENRPPTIDIRAVRFRYAEHEPYVLDGVNLEVAAGESVAIVGASGCGKSTLLHLVLGILRPSAGEILVGGVPVAHVAAEPQRRTIASVTQNDCLFAGSIADNISFFDARADHSRIQECAKLAAIHSDIAALPMAYNTLVGFMGSALSAGQQQRILLARALYARPRILVLDEATSHLDVRREADICAALSALKITRLVVAHRPQTAATADRVVTLEAGRIVASAARKRPTASGAAAGDAVDLALPQVPLGSLTEHEQALLGSVGC